MDESKTNASFMLKRRLDSLLNVVKEARVANLTNLSNFDNIEEVTNLYLYIYIYMALVFFIKDNKLCHIVLYIQGVFFFFTDFKV